MSTLQDWIHTLEEGKGSRVVKIIVAILGFAFLALVYDMRSFRNFSRPEAMDASQVARNISGGKGFTTDYIRPLSVHLILKHQKDPSALKRDHPDLANAPLYPFLLAGYMKALPFDYGISIKNYRGSYQPETWIAILNQFLFFFAVLLIYSIGKRLFDSRVGWLAAILFGLTDLFWQFSVSGLSTMLALVLFLGLVRVLMRIHQLGAEPLVRNNKVLLNAVLAGLLLGLLCMTQYSYGWLLLPALLFVGMSLQQAQVRSFLTVIVVFLLAISPWLARNYSLSGTLFGTAGFSVYQQTVPFPVDTLERSMNPDKQFGQFEVTDVARKVAVNVRGSLVKLPLLGGNWLMALFLVGLLVPVEKRVASISRMFVLTSLLVLLFVQSVGATNGPNDVGEVRLENLLVLLAPLVFVFAVGLFFTLLDRLDLFEFGLRSAIVTFFTVIISLPLILELLPPRRQASAFPPYNPPLIQLQIASLFKTNEFIISDIPAGVAWYGARPCSPLTLNYQEAFLQLNDEFRTVNAVYLSPATLDRPFLFGLYRSLLKKEPSWDRFALESLSRGEIPTGFPLKSARADLLPEHLLLADWDRWR